MARTIDRKFAVDLETLEGRDLQSGLISGHAAVLSPGVASNPALISHDSPLTSANVVGTTYHGAVGFFGK